MEQVQLCALNVKETVAAATVKCDAYWLDEVVEMFGNNFSKISKMRCFYFSSCIFLQCSSAPDTQREPNCLIAPSDHHFAP